MSYVHSVIELSQGWYDHTTPNLDICVKSKHRSMQPDFMNL